MPRPPWRAALACLLVSALGPALAQENDLTRQLGRDLAQNQQLLEDTQAQIAALEAELDDLSVRITMQLAERERLSQQIAELSRQRSQLAGEVEALNGRLVETEAEIEAEGARLEQLKDRLRLLLVSLYKQRVGRFAGLLAEAESLHELQVKNHYLSLLTDQEVALVEEVNRALDALASLQSRLTAQLNELRLKEAELQAKGAELEAARAALEGVIAELRASEEGTKAARRENLEAQEAFLRAIANLEASRQQEIARLRREAEAQREAALAAIEARQSQAHLLEAESLEAAADALAAPAAVAESDFVLPVADARLTSAFNGRAGPGIELQAAQPYAQVRAAMSGVVQTAGFFQANTGHIVIIAHGPELYTAYLNLQAPSVEVGDRVAQGDPIGYLGGGSLVRPDALFFFVGVSEGGDTAYKDPAPMLGFR